MAKKLYRKSNDKIIAGVCSGLGEYLNIDPVLVRIIALALFFLHGFGMLTYLVAWVIIPARESSDSFIVQEDKPEPSSGNVKILIGIVLIIFGTLIALDKSFYCTRFVTRIFSMTVDYFIPLALILAGVFVLLQGKKNNDKDDNNTTDFT